MQKNSRRFKRHPAKPSPLSADRLYEYLKQQWISLHPGSTPAEYEAAIRRITKLVRV